MHVIIIKWWMTKLYNTIYFCAISLEINQWNVHCTTPVNDVRGLRACKSVVVRSQVILITWPIIHLLSGVPDFFDRNKILSGYDLSHYQVPHCIRVFFYFVWFVFIHHNFQFYFELCTYCNILDIYLSQNLNFVNYLLFYMKLLNYLFFNMFGSVLECCELTGVSLL